MEGKKTTIFVGYACNNWCRFCIDLNKRHINLSTPEIINNIYEAKQNGTDIIELIGGEVTIREDFLKIIRFIKSLNFSEVYLVTNGIYFADKNFAKRVFDIGIFDNLVFSVHGNNSNLHDKLTRNPGSFKNMKKGIKNLQALGFSPYKMGSNTAIEKGNYKDLPEIGKTIYRLKLWGSSEFIFADPNEGGVHDNFNELMPRISKAAPYMKKLLSRGNNNNMLFRVRYVPLCYFKEFIQPEKLGTTNISEIVEKQIYSNVTHAAPEFKNEDVIGERQIAGRLKTDKCKGCKYYDICEGIWTSYLNKLGDDEISPIQ